jgi:2-desacetyl-2-hydroxyethyl bacteriochlorophyllide A dehydrogenase
MENGRVAVVTTAPGRVEIRPEADPAPAAGEIVVETLATGICGSDLHLFAGDHPYAHFPLAQGHEAVGRIVQAGPGADTALLGVLAAIEPTLECGTCPECRRGAYNRCERLQVVGVQLDGSLAGRFVTRAAKAHPVPDDDDPARWALVEPVAVACHAVNRSGLAAGDLAVVLGAGVIGLSIALAAARRSPEAIVVVEPNETRRARLTGLGLGVAVHPDEADTAVAELRPAGADVVFEATGVPEVLGESHRLVRPGGTVLVVGQGSGSFSMPLIVMTRKELSLVGTRNSASDFPAAIELLAGSPKFVGSVVTHRFHPSSAADAFAELTSPGTDALKVLLSYA